MKTSASNFVGRVGGLAVALGIGAGIVATSAVAAADTDATDSAGPSATGSAAHAGASRASGNATARKQTSRASESDYAASVRPGRQARGAVTGARHTPVSPARRPIPQERPAAPLARD